MAIKLYFNNNIKLLMKLLVALYLDPERFEKCIFNTLGIYKLCLAHNFLEEIRKLFK